MPRSCFELFFPLPDLLRYPVVLRRLYRLRHCHRGDFCGLAGVGGLPNAQKPGDPQQDCPQQRCGTGEWEAQTLRFFFPKLCPTVC